jgi:hypothetical protein
MIWVSVANLAGSVTGRTQGFWAAKVVAASNAVLKVLVKRIFNPRKALEAGQAAADRVRQTLEPAYLDVWTGDVGCERVWGMFGCYNWFIRWVTCRDAGLTTYQGHGDGLSIHIRAAD